MGTLPQLLEEDIQCLDGILRNFLNHTDATTALVIDKAGFLITTCGDTDQFDAISIAALASGAFMANQTIASMVHETGFSSVYQQGEHFSLLVVSLSEECLLVIIFKAGVSVGLIKYFAQPAAAGIARQLEIAHSRNPDKGIDLSVLNIADPRAVFKRKL